MSQSTVDLSNVFAEQIVLGHLLSTQNPEDLPTIKTFVDESCFTANIHKVVWLAMDAVYASGSEVNVNSVYHSIQKSGTESAVTFSDIVDLQSSVIGNIEPYCNELVDRDRARKLFALLTDAQTRIAGKDGSVDQISKAIEEGLLSSKLRSPKKRAVKPSEILTLAGGIQNLITPSSSGALLFPFYRLQKHTGGLRRQQVFIIGGIPGTGKTTFVVTNIVLYLVTVENKRVRIVSREMSKEDLLINLACARARVDSQVIRSDQATKDDRNAFNEAMFDLTETYDDLLEIDDNECTSVASAAAWERRSITADRGADLFVFDFMQQMKGIGRFKDRTEEMDSVAYNIKDFAKTYCPVIALSQLNTRKPHQGSSDGRAPGLNVRPKPPEPPLMGDFRNSSAIEACADIAMILRTYDAEQDYKLVRLVDGFIVKQRSGRMGKIPFKFHTQFGRFEEVEWQPQSEEAA